ncbi:nucleotidyltransferase domain-containing protein [Propionivibrio sp.]|uniref:nucleotidyltransferase domain-containing protein n=1 Tax=Propionivibrio sp. TaxID=2212460 RepID=UPI0025DF67FD|nr:nucleotidyltransferase domain-containing protein [Propionivibrio sp.]MBK7356733.1 nucleotidyltransferase domain-containing protein [Propionivibrio sp.]
MQRELNRLAGAGLVTTEHIGNLRCFQANPASPVFGELKSLIRKTLGIEPLLREALTQLQPKLQAALIYGSIAKQTDTAQSDIDLMLIGTDLSLNLVLELLIPTENQLGRKINPTCYTPSEFERRRAEPDSFVNRILAQPVIPLIGQIDGPSIAG